MVVLVISKRKTKTMSVNKVFFVYEIFFFCCLSILWLFNKFFYTVYFFLHIYLFIQGIFKYLNNSLCYRVTQFIGILNLTKTKKKSKLVLS